MVKNMSTEKMMLSEDNEADRIKAYRQQMRETVYVLPHGE